MFGHRARYRHLWAQQYRAHLCAISVRIPAIWLAEHGTSVKRVFPKNDLIGAYPFVTTFLYGKYRTQNLTCTHGNTPKFGWSIGCHSILSFCHHGYLLHDVFPAANIPHVAPIQSRPHIRAPSVLLACCKYTVAKLCCWERQPCRHYIRKEGRNYNMCTTYCCS